MGVPGLASQLHKYGSYVSTTQRKVDREQRAFATIDGPSLAHSLYRQGKHRPSKGGVIAQCDYHAIGQAAVAWLDWLRSYGFEIEGIYFDGALPSYKKQIRLERTQGYVNRLINFKHSYDQITKTSRVPGHQFPDARASRNLDKARDGLPPPPFMVFAVVEALFASRYADSTWLVNGEADAYCAAAAAEAASLRSDKGCTIFTNDSDLVLFQFQAQIKIAMINEMNETGSPDGNKLELYVFKPASLTVNGQSPNLLACAFYMLQQSSTLTEALRQSDQALFDPQKYREFRDLYDINRWQAELQKLRASRHHRKDILVLDSRVSEPINESKDLQCPQSNTQDSAQDTTQLAMYLPVLFEDPTRSTAWKIGSSLREVAQMLILLSSPATLLLEYPRSGTRIVPARVESVAAATVNQRFRSLTAHLKPFSPTTTPRTECNTWRQVVMQLTLQDMVQQGMTLPAGDDVLSVIFGEDQTTWEQVHLSAQFQAQYYSCRILQQIWRWWESEPRYGHDIVLQDNVRSIIESLPCIADFFASDGGLSSGGSPVKRQQVSKDLLQGLPVAQPSEQPGQQNTRDIVDRRKSARGRAVLANNPFAALSEDMG